MTLQAMWVHGTSAQIEYHGKPRHPGQFLAIDGSDDAARVGQSYGWGKAFRCPEGEDYWFHFPIPTPVIHNGRRARLRRVMVLFFARPGVALSAIHVTDGYTVVHAQEGLAVGGDNPVLIDRHNSFALPNREIQWGICVSTKFHFAEREQVTLSSVGVDFEV